MGVVKAYQPRAVRIVQRERVAQAVRSLWRWRSPFNLEFQPIALFEVVYAAIEREQKFQCVFVRNGHLLSSFISCDDSI